MIILTIKQPLMCLSHRPDTFLISLLYPQKSNDHWLPMTTNVSTLLHAVGGEKSVHTVRLNFQKQITVMKMVKLKGLFTPIFVLMLPDFDQHFEFN